MQHENANQHPTSGDSKVFANPVYGFEQPDVCEDYEFGAPLTARIVAKPATQYKSKQSLEFQMPRKLCDHLDLTLRPYYHPDPTKTGKLSFCEYVREHWDIDAVPIPGLDTSQGVGASLTPVNHHAQQYPTHLWKTDEYVLLEHRTNTPAKGKA
jgi:chitinase